MALEVVLLSADDSEEVSSASMASLHRAAACWLSGVVKWGPIAVPSDEKATNHAATW